MNYPESTRFAPVTDAAAAANPVNNAPDASVATRRRLLKHAALMAPAILTLRSGAALARESGCYAIANPASNNSNPVSVSECALQTYQTGCDSHCFSGYSDCHNVDSDNDSTTTGDVTTVCNHFCQPGALVSATAYASLGSAGRWCQ